MGKQFVEGWSVVQVLGEGAYGEVQLVINNSTNEAVAVKHLDTRKEAAAASNIQKEEYLHSVGVTHRDLKPENILLDEHELPWNEATSDCKEFILWKESSYSITPWTKIDNLALGKYFHISPCREDSVSKMSYSQPAPLLREDNSDSLPKDISGITIGYSFSQPVDPENMILTSQFSSSQMVSKGDGIEFKRHFLKIKDALIKIIDKETFVGSLPTK
ncbi:Serine/threonine-protein kinase grp like protein [Argiope bruennichi]|uniref:non-specific serine/threonine protein kinase n=1 Tax=Argiope bruennichi TaxID=94029 RepID=A0A8T0FQ94_ARGBR|nr:Serine/threonine-protein kinase grp like protein [Argiope bruennichi]